jgi:hypothetical protein
MLTQDSTKIHTQIAADGMESLVALVEAICGLPAVATLDWCDRAAAALQSTLRASSAVLWVGSVSPQGAVQSVESIGVSFQQPVEASASNELRSRLERLTNFGVGMSTPRAGKVSVATAAALFGPDWHVLPVAQASSIGTVGTLMLGVAPLGNPAEGRVLIALVASEQTIPEWVAGVLSSTLPSLARKATTAIGASTAARGAWISPREQMVLEQLILGKSVKQIADDLGRSPHTVHDHVKALHRKLNASSRGELVARALGHLTEGSKARTSPVLPQDDRRAA